MSCYITAPARLFVIGRADIKSNHVAMGIYALGKAHAFFISNAFFSAQPVLVNFFIN